MLSTWIKTAQFRLTRADNAIVPSEPEPLGSRARAGCRISAVIRCRERSERLGERRSYPRALSKVHEQSE